MSTVKVTDESFELSADMVLKAIGQNLVSDPVEGGPAHMRSSRPRSNDPLQLWKEKVDMDRRPMRKDMSGSPTSPK